MLHEAGFQRVQAFLPVYSYQFPVDLWPSDGNGHELRRSLRAAEAWVPPDYWRVVARDHAPFKRAIMQIVLRAHVERLVWPYFVFLAER
jgi:hypothetical protein